jgi:hypothetical protein
MPYKIGFQPAGVKHDRTGEYMEARRRNGEERDKEEGRLGRRWAKVSFVIICLLSPTSGGCGRIMLTSPAGRSTF